MPTPPASTTIFSISALNAEIKELIEGTLPYAWVEGEISNLARPASGHIYFSLKDARAQVRCAMFRGNNRRLDFTPENGQQVLAHARVSLYEARGDFQLVIEDMQPAGDGALQLAFEQLKKTLAAQGLFDEKYKRPLPPVPERVGIITSASGAALHDIISVLQRRSPSLPLLIYPTAVQGAGAAAEIAACVELANQRAECSVLIVARGGGSLEDLWAFNEEIVARAIHASTIPVVSGIGHETDFTIADLVADQRAATPSAAAELVGPDQAEWLGQISSFENRISALLTQHIERKSETLGWLSKRIHNRHPGQQIQNWTQRLDELDQRQRSVWASTLSQAKLSRQHLLQRLMQQTPSRKLAVLKESQGELKARMQRALSICVDRKSGQLAAISSTLNAVSPLATLSRGYAIVENDRHQVIRQHTDVNTGERIRTRLGNGSLLCRVEETVDD